MHATVVHQQIDNGNIANQIHGFTIDYDKFILILIIIMQPANSYHRVFLSIFNSYFDDISTK